MSMPCSSIAISLKEKPPCLGRPTLLGIEAPMSGVDRRFFSNPTQHFNAAAQPDYVPFGVRIAIDREPFRNTNPRRFHLPREVVSRC